MALAAAVYMSTLGKCGLRTVAELCYHKSHYAAAEIDALRGYVVDTRRPFFKEFVVKCPSASSRSTIICWKRGASLEGMTWARITLT